MKIRPTPQDHEEQERWQASGLRHRILAGQWAQDLRQDLSQFFAPQVVARMTCPDLSRNLLLSYVRQVDLLYRAPDGVPVLVGGEPLVAPEIVTPYLWPVRGKAQRYALGMGEGLVRLDWIDGQVACRPVTSDRVVALADPQHPDVPIRIEELVERSGPAGDLWTWEIWDIRDPESPIFRIESIDDKGMHHDVTTTYIDTTGYPYRDTAGKPILPYILCHAEVGRSLWHENIHAEIVSGTLRVASLWTFWTTGVRDAAHPQRYGMDIEIPSGVVPSRDGVEYLPMDQTSILPLRSKGDKQGSLGTLPPAMDVKLTAEAIQAYAAGCLVDAGLAASSVQIEGSSTQSGYALAISKEGQRAAAMAQVPAAKMADQQLLATAARMANAYAKTTYPEQPEAYSIAYPDVGRSTQEQNAAIERATKLLAAGLISPVEAKRLIQPELSVEEAVKALVEGADFTALIREISGPKLT